MPTRRLLVPLALLLMPVLVRAQPALDRAALDDLVAQVRAAFEVPGMAVAVVHEGAVVVAAGYGVRTLGDAAPVDAHTRFGIASNTKAFTATALALLVEEGKVAWDAPVTRYLPGFALADTCVTRLLTVRDLLVHRSGLALGAGDLLWWPGTDLSRAEIVRRLRWLPLDKGFRSAYAYDNVLYSVAGHLVEQVSGQTWEDFVRTRILAPVGMADAAFRDGTVPTGNVAATHARVEGQVRRIEPFTNANTNPAGGILASAADMARWMIVQLDSGRVAPDTRLFTPRTTDQLWSLVTPIPIGRYPADLHALQPQFNGYGLGFHVKDYRGVKVVTHTGGNPGYVSQVTLVPALKLGVAVLTNQEAGEAFTVVTQHVLDQYLGAHDTDWLAVFSKLHAAARAETQQTVADAAAQRDSLALPSLPAAAYAGTYRDAWYGDVEITETDGHLVMRFSHTPALVGDLTHWEGDTFVVRWRDRSLRADAFVTFDVGTGESVQQATMRAVSPDTDFSFDFHHLLLKPVA